MDCFRVRGGQRISGHARIHTAKNAVLPIMAAACMVQEQVIIKDCPCILDAHNMLDILSDLGCGITKTGNDVYLEPGGMTRFELPDELSKRLRSSIFLTGPLLARFGRVVITYPGGCEIGLRPIDLHLSGLAALGARISEHGGRILLEGYDMHGADVHLDYPSVGATENIMMAATAAKGTTRIFNAAREPEIDDLACFMNACGACVSGTGSPVITVEGQTPLHGATFKPMGDRIEAGTLLCAAAITGGQITLTDAPVQALGAVCAKIRMMGCQIIEGEDTISLQAPENLLPIDILKTQPFPGFPTDMQAQMTALCCAARGASLIVETVFESRFAHAQELTRMGADIAVDARTMLVRGGRRLHGANVTARDLRGGAALILAALWAQGETIIDQVHLVDRGYCEIEQTLRSLGADIERIDL